MNRRTLLAGAGTAILGAATGYGSLRVADVRPYDPALPTGDAPRERIVAAARHRHAVDHRATTRVRVLEDWTGEAPYDLDVRRQWHEHSRRRHLHTLTTFAAPLTRNDSIADEADREFVTPHQLLWALFHYNRVYSDSYDLPLTNVLYVTDGTMLYDFDAPAPKNGRVRISKGDSGTDVVADDDDAARAVRGDFVRPHRTDWTKTAERDGTVTYRVSGPDAYAQVVPLPFAPISEFGDCWIEVTLNRETGRLRRIVDNRALVVDLWEGAVEKSLTYRIETEFDQYGVATARRPIGPVDRSLESRAKALLFDLMTY
ncbi:hypothetical protein D3D02_13755 [Halobellus sp. Atlit-38R]|uniref:hypothetical protein n=1 Tax=Halobellus sp. Atlit-38R TaxID=2282131 RepID=UPI000EF27E85|nr:hypothetical protein [Halobellus sp. Atlit-38R]RLM87995.1 hypothetical protein D3D02_13755 [Halobellus sp. Atlit-38R]